MSNFVSSLVRNDQIPSGWRAEEVIPGPSLVEADRFVSDRVAEGVVEVVCSSGCCPHDTRPDSTHVRGVTGESAGNHWFVVTAFDSFIRVSRI